MIAECLATTELNSVAQQPMRGKKHFGVVQSSKNIIDGDSNDENEMNISAPVPTSSEMRGKSMRSYLEAHSNGEMNNKMDDNEQFNVKNGNDKRRKQKDPKRKAIEPPPEETDNDKCRHHKEIQKRIKMMNGRLSFLEHCIQSEKEFPDLTDDDALVGFQNEHDKLSSQKEQNLARKQQMITVVSSPPKKFAKKLKLSDPIAGTSQPVNVQNKFSSLSGKDAEITPTTSNQTAAPISARPKVPPIMFKHKKANYKLIVKNLNKDFPDCDVKLAGKYLKIFCKSSDEHRIVTDYLREISEEFYVIDPPDSRPLKIVIKGLPISTEIGEIQDDLTSQGFSVEKVAQLTRSKTKSPLPIFMVELEKKPDSPDIFKMKKCCCLTLQVDAFNRRPGVSQCYNCNLFNHSSKNCFMRTRCLKCGESHLTNECPIKEKIENPVCINCNKTGHMANWSQCEEFPKRKPRKGETIRNRNTSTETNKTSKHRSPQISPSQLLSRALLTKTILPELRPPLKKPLQPMKKVMKKTLALKTR
ncbi:nucleic-acid-binding protein from transposon X-element [Trichonephila clavipes]|nr:nucleic-acid-binding protein from transposon X-element [Trichonephila clavipes]